MASSPVRMERILEDVGFNRNQINRVKQGELVSEIHGSGDGSEREIATRMAFFIQAPVSKLCDTLMENPKQCKFDEFLLQSGMISETNGVTLQDFDDLDFGKKQKEVTRAYIRATQSRGDTDLNLSLKERNELKQALEGIDTSDEQDRIVNDFIRNMLVRRVLDYQQYGLNGIAPYLREKQKVYSPGDELHRQTSLSKTIATEVPSFHKHLSNYPHDKPENDNHLRQHFSWAHYDADGNKPTFLVLVHRMSNYDDGGYAFCERNFYVSSTHNCVQVMGGAFPVENDGGTIFVSVTRASTDQVMGFGSSVKKRVGARLMQSQMTAVIDKFREESEKDQD